MASSPNDHCNRRYLLVGCRAHQNHYHDCALIYGYARVSTLDQDTTLQLDALARAGCQTIVQEKTSSIGKRPELRRLLSSLQPHDHLVVYKLDRLARSLKDLLQIFEHLERCGCTFRSITESIDTQTPVGKLMLNILGSFAEFERGIIRERAIAGQAAVYQRGTRWGGQPKVVNDLDAQCVYKLHKTGDFTIPLLADIFDCSQSSIWRIIWRKDRPMAPSVRRDAPILSAYLAQQDEKKAS